MNPTETDLVNKYLNEIHGAEGAVRTALLNEYYALLGVIEKRISLSKLESVVGAVVSEAKALGDKAETVFVSAVQAVENHL